MNDKFDADKIIALAAASPLAKVSWRGRGKAPLGYVKGMALVYARVIQHLHERDPMALEMAKSLGSPDHDVLAYFPPIGSEATYEDRLRSLFTVLYGLGMRESSGMFCAGRDLTARNTSANTAEAGLFQMSWNASSCSKLIPELLKVYSNADEGYGLGKIFHEGVRATFAQLANYGDGQGFLFQATAKGRPAFAVEAAAIGVRNLRKAWGPINRREVEIRPEATALLKQIEELPAPPVPEPAPSVMDRVRKLFGG